MQKKLIALAVAGLISAPAMAQSNVQIYGVVDLGLRHLSSSEAFGALAKHKSRTAIDHSGQVSSRLGFRGTEDLGNGLKAFFTIEQSLSPDTTAVGGNRQAFLGLEGGFGRFWMGRDFNQSRAFVTGLDPFGSTGIGNNQNIMLQDARYDNAVFYRSPSFSGLTVGVSATNRTSGDEVSILKGASDTNRRGISIAPVYKNGPLTVGGGYEKYSRGGDETRWNLGGGYDFGVADVRVVYSQNKNEEFVNDPKAKSWMLAAVVPVSEAGKVLVSWNQTKISASGVSDMKARQIALGYTHALSKRTHVYATYAKINTNSAAEGAFSVDRSASWSGLNTSVRGYTSGMNVGVRHSF